MIWQHLCNSLISVLLHVFVFFKCWLILHGRHTKSILQRQKQNPLGRPLSDQNRTKVKTGTHEHIFLPGEAHSLRAPHVHPTLMVSPTSVTLTLFKGVLGSRSNYDFKVTAKDRGMQHCSKVEWEVSSKYKMCDYLMRLFWHTLNNMQYARTYFSMLCYLQLYSLGLIQIKKNVENIKIKIKIGMMM